MSQATLVERVSALRRRLEEIAPREVAPLSELSTRLRQLQDICRQAHLLHQQVQAVEAQAQKAADSNTLSPHTGHDLSGPKRICWQTRRWLVECRQCLQTLKALGETLNGSLLDEPRLLASYQLSVSMAECLLRGLQALPESALEQNRIAQGLGGWVFWLKTQVSAIHSWVQQSQRVSEQVQTLAYAIQSLCQRRPVLSRTLLTMADELAHGDWRNRPLQLLTPRLPGEQWAAIHGWNTAQLVARIVHRHRELRRQASTVILAALLHDVGMATISPEILEHNGPLSDSQRQEVEAHVGISAEAVRLMFPEETWLLEGILAHHERLDGSGYPAGKQGRGINSLARLLGVADTYAALATPRPYRPALPSRQVLTEVLAEAEKGRLDVAAAELLLSLSLHPVGSIVELSDGSVGQVVALNQTANESVLPAPIVAVLLDKEGTPVAIPRYVNLAEEANPHVVRQIPAEELKAINPFGWWMQMTPV